MQLARCLPFLVLLAACGERAAETPAPAPVRDVPRVAPAEPDAAAPADLPLRPEDAARQRRRANLNGWLDLTELPDDLRFVVGDDEASGVVELLRGTYRLAVLRDEREVANLGVEVSAGQVTRVDPSVLRMWIEAAEAVSHVCERAVDHRASWTAAHQAEDGSWGASDCGHAACATHGESAAAATGLGLLSYLGTGETHRSGEYKDQVKRGLRYLKQVQDADGWFVGAGPARNRSQAIATLAFVEAFGITRSRLFTDGAQRSVDALLAARAHGVPWTRDDFGGADAETTVWAVFCLKSAEMARLQLPPDAMADARTGLGAFGDPGASGLSLRESAGLTAARIFAGADPLEDDAVRSGIERLMANLPARGSDPLYVYFGTIATFQASGADWRRWNESLKSAVVDTQRTDEDAHERGSWDPEGPEASAMGRMPTTAAHTLTLAMYYRYGRVFGGPR